MDAVFARSLLSLPVQCRHDPDHFLLRFFRRQLRLYRRIHDAAPDLLCQDQHIALPASIVLINLIRMDKTRDCKTVFRHIILDRVPAHEHCPGFMHFIRPAAEDFP